jgi:ribosome-associated toxin RatA of RatAB toxin-antitoxin module
MKKITYKEMFELINKVEAFNKPITMCLTQDAFDSHDWQNLLGYNVDYRIIPDEFKFNDNIVYIMQDKPIKVQIENSSITFNVDNVNISCELEFNKKLDKNTEYDIVEIKDDEM